MFTQKDAEAIAKKLNAERKQGRKHDIVVIRVSGKYIGQFGICRGSKDQCHDHISRQMFLTAKQCREFRECSLSLEAYIEILRSKGLLS